ncbi:hypothetical protein SYNPS1DRAFT_31416 [Syncephalis pseudoplumigaleata]|uniref:Uncharacterized protein n=1 Tax=Syncephalis pseudoplumigaleata TaxID=1712513 RepID=A0A4V1J0V8_9FUNG|nr:hypothetical protein SYNPS1DRAFT_31416 [Syncephalis pseudoplumigaleata]|eukprot:RKP22909.1 hypothetical protein SYNPS1DRAFT_31416 [Syncephalis pseudoplumigaleata]
MHAIIIKSALLLALGTAFTAEARPPPIPSEHVGFRNNCGLIGKTKYICRENSGLTCGAMPGQTQKICLKTSKHKEVCDNDSTRCAKGLVCSIYFLDTRGTCVDEKTRS